MKTETIEVQGVQYELRELAHKDAVDVFEQDSSKWLGMLATRSIFVDGKPIGNFDDMGLSITLKLMPEVSRFYGLSEGKD